MTKPTLEECIYWLTLRTRKYLDSGKQRPIKELNDEVVVNLKRLQRARDVLNSDSVTWRETALATHILNGDDNG